MGFFQNIKNKLGIGGVDVQLQVPGQVEKQSGTIEGKVVLTTKSEQQLVELRVKLVETYSTGRGDEKKEKEIELGKCVVPYNMTGIKPGETVETPFSLPFNLVLSSNDELK